jgi:nucleotide-binding universal stress UspA family protein
MEVDLLVMGTLGAASPSEKILGSVTAEVIDRTECPVLVIPAETTYQPIEQILYAAALTKQDLQAINQLRSLADPLEANIHSLHIKAQHKPLEIGWEAFEQMYEAEHSASFTFEVVEKENVFRGLQVLMSERKVDLLAMTTFHQQWKDRAVTPSLTREIMLYTDIPMLIFHAG